MASTESAFTRMSGSVCEVPGDDTPATCSTPYLEPPASEAGGDMIPDGDSQVPVSVEPSTSASTWADSIHGFFRSAQGGSPDSLTMGPSCLPLQPGRTYIGAFDDTDYYDIANVGNTLPECTEAAGARPRYQGDDTDGEGSTAAVRSATTSSELLTEIQGGEQTSLPNDGQRGTVGTQHESIQREPFLSVYSSLCGWTAKTLQSAFTLARHPVATTQKWAVARLQPAMKAWDGWTKASEPFKSAAVGGAVSLLGLAVLRTAVNTATDVKTCLDAWSRPIGSSVG